MFQLTGYCLIKMYWFTAAVRIAKNNSSSSVRIHLNGVTNHVKTRGHLSIEKHYEIMLKQKMKNDYLIE